MLERVWTAEHRNSPWAKAAIKNVVTTFGGDSEASAAPLRKAFEIDHLMQHGHEELNPMAREAARLARLDPEFVRDLYIAAFAWQETSDDQTFLFQSRLTGFLSNRAQNYTDTGARARHGQDQNRETVDYVRDDRPAGHDVPQAVWFAYTPDRKGEHRRSPHQPHPGTSALECRRTSERSRLISSVHLPTSWTLEFPAYPSRLTPDAYGLVPIFDTNG